MGSKEPSHRLALVRERGDHPDTITLRTPHRHLDRVFCCSTGAQVLRLGGLTFGGFYLSSGKTMRDSANLRTADLAETVISHGNFLIISPGVVDLSTNLRFSRRQQPKQFHPVTVGVDATGWSIGFRNSGEGYEDS